MIHKEILTALETLNESEIFYRDYRLAKASPALFDEWLSKVDMDMVYRNNLLLPERIETIPPEYLDEWFFSKEKNEGVHVFKHNCYTPAIPHHHNFYEMFYVLKGQCLHRVGEKPSLLHAGDLCLIQPKVTHSIDVSDESVVIDVLIRKSTFRQYFYSILQGDNILSGFFMSTLSEGAGMDYIIFHAPDDYELENSFYSLCREVLCREEYYNTLINSIVVWIFVILLRRYQNTCEYPANRPQYADQADKILRYLQANAAETTLTQFAQHFHYTPESASRRIKQVTGHTYSQLLTDIRIANAKQLLRDTSLSAAEIGTAVGYESPEHFMRIFKKITGITPAEYRKNGH